MIHDCLFFLPVVLTFMVPQQKRQIIFPKMNNGQWCFLGIGSGFLGTLLLAAVLGRGFGSVGKAHASSHALPFAVPYLELPASPPPCSRPPFIQLAFLGDVRCLRNKGNSLKGRLRATAVPRVTCIFPPVCISTGFNTQLHFIAIVRTIGLFFCVLAVLNQLRKVFLHVF